MVQVSADFLCFLLPPRRVRFRGRFEPTPKRRRRTVRSVVRGAEGQDSSWSRVYVSMRFERSPVWVHKHCVGRGAEGKESSWLRLFTNVSGEGTPVLVCEHSFCTCDGKAGEANGGRPVFNTNRYAQRKIHSGAKRAGG